MKSVFKNIFKKLVNRRKHEVLHNFLVNGCSDVGFQKTQRTNTSRWHCTPNHHRLWKLNTGLQATWAMSFSTLPPDSRTLVSKWNTKLSILLDYPHKTAVLSVDCASFSSTLFPSTQLSVNMLGYSTLWTASLAMNVCGLPSLWRVSMIVFWTTVRSAVFPMIV